MKRHILIITLIAIALTGCNKTPEPEPSDLEKARDGLYELMDYAYLWRTHIPSIDKSDYSNPEDLLEAMRYTDKDKWSFVSDYESFIASMGGEFVGHGISMALDTNDVVRVVLLYNKSDLWARGVRRGWIIEEINDTPIAPIFISQNGDAYNALLGASTAGIINKFLFKKPDGTEVTYNSTKASFTINSVLSDTVLDLPSGKTAYLCFKSFIDPSEAELNEAFASFVAKGAQDLIIDLRYNGGGYTDIATQLASLCVDNTYTTKVCYNLKYNAYISADWNQTHKFISTTSPLGLDRIVFITTRSTASASEVVINSLKPYMDVYLVGDTTHGKPCGMNLWGFPFDAVQESDYVYVFAPITFEYTNSLGQGGFYEGLEPDELATDDIMHDFGDPEEHSLKTAISILQGLKSSSNVKYHPTKVYNEGDQLPTNLINRLPKEFKK